MGVNQDGSTSVHRHWRPGWDLNAVSRVFLTQPCLGIHPLLTNGLRQITYSRSHWYVPLKSIFISMNLDIGTRFRINGSSITSIVGDDRCYFHTDLRVRQGIQ